MHMPQNAHLPTFNGYMETTPTILTIHYEDDEAGGRMLRALFQSEGCQVLVASRGAQRC